MKMLLYSALVLLCFATSCTTVKPYQRQFVDDPEMQMADDRGQQFSGYIHSIREGATPANGAKGSGGCGCN